MKNGKRPSRAEVVISVLRQYSDRGVFGGLDARIERGGQWEYTFTWLLGRPMTLRLDPRAGVLRFQSLFPDVAKQSSMVAELRSVVERYMRRELPAHRRLDARRARAFCMVRAGDLSLILKVRGPHYAYAVRRALNLINEMFLLLHEHYPAYLSEQFGLSAE